ncbi:MAG: hypothetical protein INR65_09045, partial [Gluconacetobacter diazotrophicus]|nr:hypothetical protein [Gluconacetobacter diazotrophicus]
QANLTAGTYGQLAGASLTVGQLARAALSAAQADGTLTTSLAATLNGLSAAPGAPAVPLSRLFSLAAYAYQPIGSALTSSALVGNLDLFTLLDDAAAIAAGSGPLTIAPSVAGISAVSVQAAVGQPAQSSPFGTFSPVGTGVQTAQVRLQVTLTLANVAAGALLNQTLTVPVYVEAAKGIATLSAISCGRNPRTDAVVTVGGTTGTATAAIGTVSSGGLANFAATPTLQPATILSTNVAGVVKPVAVTASGTTTVLPGKGTLSFTQAQIAQTPPVVQTISANQVLVSPALYNAVQFGSLPSTISAADLLKALKPILGDGTNPGVLDTIVSSALGAFGIRLGAMDVTVPGVRCGVPVLVQ